MDLQQALLKAKHKHHRTIVFLQGDSTWLKYAFAELRKKLNNCFSVILSDSDTEWRERASENTTDQQLASKHFKQLLGTESAVLVWDLTTPLNHDALAASSGIVHGGGVLVVLSNEPNSLRVEKSELKNAEIENTRFKRSDAPTYDLKRSEQRIIRHLFHHKDTVVLHASNFEEALKTLGTTPSLEREITNAQHHPSIHLNAEQLKCVDRIKHVAKGHRNRPLVIRADRGRGKSTALGVAIAQLICSESHRSVIVVTDQKAGVDVLRQSFKHALSQSQREADLTLWPSDALIDELPNADLIVIDEAASLPLHSLEKIIAHYPRLVLASTMHGYEGSGRGFDIKLDAMFKKTNKAPRYETLSTPIRWGENDPLEQLVNSSFVLDANLFEEAPPSERCNESDFKNAAFCWVDQRELTNNEPLLRSVFSLLVLAHYQTRPSDLAHLLDDPDLSIGVFCSNDDNASSPKILAVTLCINETLPELGDSQLHEQIVSGERRLKGKLVPQALAMFYNDPAWLRTKLLRVMRIVVRPEFQRHGLGSMVLDMVLKKAEEEQYDGCSVSFGVEADLVRFWERSNYQPLRLSYRSDASSGLPSLMLVSPLNEETQKRITNNQAHFYQHLIGGLSAFYQTVSSDALVSILSHNSVAPHAPAITEATRDKLRRYIDNAYAQWDCWLELTDLALAACSQRGIADTEDARQLLDYVVRLKQHHQLMPNVGKKAWDTYLREASGRLLFALDESTVKGSKKTEENKIR